VAEAGQVCGEGAALFGGEGGEAQATERSAIEDGADFACRLQSAEDGGFGTVRARPSRSQFLDVGQGRVVQGGARAQEVSGSREEVIDVFGELPVIREHAS
jgi:hypothetical protein